jgi:hypothetical protein
VERMTLREQIAPLPVRTLLCRTLVIILSRIAKASCSMRGAIFRCHQMRDLALSGGG